MTNDETNLKSSINKTSTMRHTSRPLRSLHFSETIAEDEEREDTPSDNKNIPHLKRNTPILFSTNRGLHLRVTSNTTSLSAHTTTSTSKSANTTSPSSSINSTYNMTFCDLERWSTNRANTISLEDTFTIPKPAVVPLSAASSSLVSTSLRFVPQKSTSLRFSGYDRFDVE